jgi:predicted permease
VRLGGHPVSIVGVAPDTFKGTWVPGILSAQVWVPLRAAANVVSRSASAAGGHRTLAILRPEVGHSQAHAAVEAIGFRFPVEGPARQLAVLPGSDGIQPRGFVTAGAAISSVVLAVSAIVLIIVCANLANLLLARNAARAPEIAIRMALGASPQQILRLVMVETALLLMGAAVLGAFVTHGAIQLIERVPLPALDGIPITLDPTPDLSVLFYAAGALLLTILIAGLLPARVLAQADPMRTLSSAGGVGGISIRTRRLSRRLVSLQVVFSVLLLLGAGLTARAAWKASHRTLGFDVSRTVVATMDTLYQRPDRRSAAEFRSALLRAVRGMSGTVAASLATAIPGTGRTSIVPVSPVESAERFDPGLRAAVNRISPDFFAGLGLRLSQGRDFTDRDSAADRHVAIISQSLAERLWPGQPAIGRTLMTTEPGSVFEIVAIAPDLSVAVGSEGIQHHVYFPLAQADASTLYLVVREREPGIVRSSLSREIRAVDPDIPVLDVQPLSRVISLRQAPGRLLAGFAVGLAGLGFAVALLGIYGTMAYWLSRRTREFGIHKAVGATEGDLRLIVVREGVSLVLAGVLTSMIIALIIGEISRAFLPGINLRDPLTFVVVPTAFLATALLACHLAARRVIRVDPSVVLRDAG